jgi:hypothetical protein
MVPGVLFALLAAARVEAAAPLGLFHDDSFTNVEAYEKPGAVLITGNCNRYAPPFTAARAAGATVLAYLNPIDAYDVMPCKLSAEFYQGGHPPLWPFPRTGERINYHNTHLADVRAGSDWSDDVVAYVERLMTEGKVDGVFLDVVGARLWSPEADWKHWDRAEQDAWTRGCVDLVRRIDERRRAINPRFIVVTNNLWDRGDSLGLAGEKYVDGIMLEHPRFDRAHEDYAGRRYGDLGHRLVLVIARDEADARRWNAVPGVDALSYQPRYDHPGPPAAGS